MATIVAVDPVELLRRLQVALATGRLPAEVCGWLRYGIDQYLAGAGPLEQCLGLRPKQGKPSPPTQLRSERRTELVRRLARGLAGGPWQQAANLERAIRGEPSGMQKKYLDSAAQTGIELPTSRVQLYRILARKRG